MNSMGSCVPSWVFGRAVEHVVIRIDQEQVVVVRRAINRVGPLQDDGAGAAPRDPVPDHTPAEVV